MTLAAAPPIDVAPRTSSEAFVAIPEHLHCPNCDHDVTSICAEALSRAQQQLTDLEKQVQVLNEKATAAVDRWGDYEDQLHTLRKQLQEARAPTPTPTPTPTQSRFSFLSPRKQALPSSLPTPQHSPHQSTSTSTTSLTPSAAVLLAPPLPEKDGPVGGGPGVHRPYPNPLDLASAEISDLSGKLSAMQIALRHESLLRHQAEEKALAGGRELEDLTAQLFEEANRMVSDERKQKAKLEERLKILEEREARKRGKLEMIEAAQMRIERVQKLIGPKGEVEEKKKEEVVVIKPGRVIGRKSLSGHDEEKGCVSGASSQGG